MAAERRARAGAMDSPAGAVAMGSPAGVAGSPTGNAGSRPGSLAAEPISLERRRTIDNAALRALVYADLFDYPLTAAEIWRFLPDVATTAAEIEACLSARRSPGSLITSRHPFHCLRLREAIVSLRTRRATASRPLWLRARFLGHILARTPWIRMVAVTGSLAMDNCDDGQADIDLLIVTSPSRVWLVRGWVVLLSRVLPGRKLCPNFVLDETRLRLRHRDLYTAHELIQMVPLFGDDVHRRMLRMNDWIDAFLPNARLALKMAPRAGGIRIGQLAQVAKTGLEWLGDRTMAGCFERLERWRRINRAARAGRLPGPRVIMDEHECKAHYTDYPGMILDRYQAAAGRALAGTVHANRP